MKGRRPKIVESNSNTKKYIKLNELFILALAVFVSVPDAANGKKQKREKEIQINDCMSYNRGNWH